jgi:hypothetical protein
MRAAFTAKGRFFYQVYFQDEGVAEAELEADVRMSLRKFVYAISGDAPDGTWPKNKPHGARLLDGLPDPQPFPAWLDEAPTKTTSSRSSPPRAFAARSTATATTTRDFAWQQQFTDRQITQPALFIGGERDLVLEACCPA